MPSINVGDSVELAYDDSGAPPPSTRPYVTVVLIHGTIFYNKSYSKLLSLAPQHSLRLLAVNMRDYPGSTTNTQEELDDLASDDAIRQAKYIKSAALQIATFAARAITTLNLPKPTSDRSAGGVTILGWSSGTLYMSSLLAHADSLPPDDKTVLSNYLRTVVLFDPAFFPTGHPVPAAVLAAPPGSPLYSPMRDTTITDAERIAKFFTWFSAYFEPPVKEMFPLCTEADVQAAIKLHTSRFQTGVPTLQRMSPAEKASVADFSERVKVSNQMLRFTQRSVYKDNYLRAFTVSDGDGAVWPQVDVLVAWGELSVFETSWTASMIRDWLENGSRSVQKFGPDPKDMAHTRARRVRYESIEGGNHFMILDDPERVIRFLAQYA